MYRCFRARLNINDFFIIVASSLGLGLIGAWLFFIAVQYSFLELIAIIRMKETAILFQGGLIYYGGFIGGVLGAFLGARVANAKLIDFINPILPSLPLGHAIGRIGCFSAGCCYGKPTASSLGAIFRNPVGGAPAGVSLFPVQLFESGLNLIIFAVLLLYLNHAREKKHALILYIVTYGVVRFTLEWFRGDALRGGALGLSTSQWISISSIALALLYLLIDFVRKRTALKASPD